MIRVLLDTNIVLDVLLDRPPWNSQVTRDPHGFVSSEVEAIEPEELLNRLAPGS
jgi:hypothetical protein